MHRCIALLTTAVCLLTRTAAADSVDDFGRIGFYGGVGAAIGSPIGYADEMETVFGLQAHVDAAVGANVRAGWRALPWLAAEAYFEWLPGFDVNTSSDDTRFAPWLLDGSTIIDSSTWMASVNAKAFARHTERFQPFLEVGFGYMQVSSDLLRLVHGTAGGYATRMGAGIDCYIDRSWVVSIDALYVLPTGDVTNFDYISVGLDVLYRF